MQLTLKEIQELETEMLKEISSILDREGISYCIAYGTALGALRHSGPIPWDPDADIIIPYNQLEQCIKALRSSLSEKFFLDFHDINPYYTATFPRVGLRSYSSVALHVDIFIACGLPKQHKKQVKLIEKFKKLRKIHYYKIASDKYIGKLTTRHKLKVFIFQKLYLPISLKKIRKEFYSLCAQYNIENSEYITNPSGGYKLKEIIPKSYLDNSKPMSYQGFTLKSPQDIHSYLKHFYGDYLSLPPENERQVRNTYYIHKLELD